MRYAIYARVSPKGSGFETETSIDMQIQFCKDFIASQRGEVIEIQKDEFYSGKDTKRPGFQKLMKQLAEGRAQWDTIAVYKLSRLTRSSRDGAQIFDDLRKWGKGFVSVTEPSFDFSTPVGRAMLSIFQAFNQFEREQTSENTKNRMISIAASGGWPVGNAPFGYMRAAKHDNTLRIEPRNAEAVIDIFESYAGDTPLFKIAKKYARAPQMILYTLKNPTYIGMIPYAGKIYKGKHERIISDELFERVQKKIASTSTSKDEKIIVRRKSQKRPYILAGKIRCSCGRFMTPSNGKSGQYFYYRCTDTVSCKNVIPAGKVEDAVIDVLSKHVVDSEFIRGFRDEIAQIRAERVKEFTPAKERITSAIAEAKREQKRIVDLFIRGTVDASNAAFFNEKLSTVSKEIVDLESKLEYINAELQRADDKIPSALEQIADNMLSMRDTLSNMPENADIRREIIMTFVDRITVTKEKEIELEFIIPDSTSENKNGVPIYRRYRLYKSRRTPCRRGVGIYG